MNKEQLNLVELLKEIVNSASINYEKQSGQINFAYEKFNQHKEQFNIEADRMHLTNILYNLLDNSLKYNENNPQVTIDLVSKNNKVSLSISDNGIGIDDKYVKQIFDKFYRVPTGNVHNVKGFGLGLYYVKQVVNEHHWKIGIKSEVGKGTTTFIYF